MRSEFRPCQCDRGHDAGLLGQLSNWLFAREASDPISTNSRSV